MSLRRMLVLTLAASTLVVTLVATGPAALAGTTPAPTSEQTHPQVKPHAGRRDSIFHLRFTLAQAPGRSGLETTSYQAVVTAPAHLRASCSPTQPAAIVSGDQGSVVRIALRPSAHGWCKGRYAVTVYLETTVACGPLAGPGVTPCCGPPVEATELPRIPYCPVSADPVRSDSTLDTGTAHFRVR